METGLTLPGEPKGKCCWFVPLKQGVILIGVLIVVFAAFLVQQCLTFLSGNATFIYAVLYGVAAAPNVLGAFYYVKWFMNMDAAETKQGLFKACLLTILSAVISVGVSVVMALTLAGHTFGDLIVSILVSGVTSLLFFYFAGACKKYASE